MCEPDAAPASVDHRICCLRSYRKQISKLASIGSEKKNHNFPLHVSFDGVIVQIFYKNVIYLFCCQFYSQDLFIALWNNYPKIILVCRQLARCIRVKEPSPLGRYGWAEALHEVTRFLKTSLSPAAHGPLRQVATQEPLCKRCLSKPCFTKMVETTSWKTSTGTKILRLKKWVQPKHHLCLE